MAVAASIAPAKDIAAALRYGPKTAATARRSAYLEDALQSLSQSGGENIRSPWELGSKLLAMAILKRGSDKASKATLDAIRADRSAEADSLLSALSPRPAAPAPQPPASPAAAMPGPNAALPSEPPMAERIPSPPKIEQSQLPPISRDDAFERAWAANKQTESGGRGDALGPPTQYGQAEGSTQMLPETARAMAFKAGLPWRPDLLRGTSPEHLQYQDALGREYFAEGWRAYGGDPVMAAMYYHGGPNREIWGPNTQRHAARVLANMQGGAENVAPPAAPQAPPPPLPAPTPISSPAPPSSPPAAGAPPAQLSQAPAGGNPAQAWPTYQPRPEEVDYIRQLLADPRTFEEGRAEAMKLRQKMTQPAPAKIVEMNGVQFYVPETPGQGSSPVMIPIPQEARSRVQPIEQTGMVGPRGTYTQTDPYGNSKIVQSPPTGQQVVSNPGEPYREGYVPGGANDPYRVQAPPQNYRYTAPGGGVEAVPGSPADIRNPANLIEATKGVRQEIAPIITQAITVKRNIDSVRTGYRQQNGSGDIAMVNGIQKLIDEGVVREGDVALQLQAQGIQGGIAGVTSFLQSNGKFDPAIRQKIMRTAEGLYAASNETLKSRVMGYRSIVDPTYGQGSFDRYVLPPDTATALGWGDQPGATAPPRASPTFQPGTRDAAIAEAVRRQRPLTPQQQARARELGLIR